MRRSVVVVLALAVAALAGCSGNASSTPSVQVATPPKPTAAAPGQKPTDVALARCVKGDWQMTERELERVNGNVVRVGLFIGGQKTAKVDVEQTGGRSWMHIDATHITDHFDHQSLRYTMRMTGHRMRMLVTFDGTTTATYRIANGAITAEAGSRKSITGTVVTTMDGKTVQGPTLDQLLDDSAAGGSVHLRCTASTLVLDPQAPAKANPLHLELAQTYGRRS